MIASAVIGPDTAVQTAQGISDNTTSHVSGSTKRVSNCGKIVNDLRSIQEQDLQKRCIVVSGLPEAESDVLDAQALIKEIDRSVSIVSCYRLGRYVSKDYKRHDGTVVKKTTQRLLKVELASSTVAASVLANASSLKNSTLFSKCFVRRSMSLNERNELKRTRDRAMELNNLEGESSTTKFVVINEKIIRFVNCVRDGSGDLRGGRRDHSWSDMQE